jgi:hypothetical protein
MKTSTQRVLTILLTLFSLAAVGQKAQAVVPAPDGCYPNFTTVEGCNALQSLSAGAGNTGLGWRSLFSDSTGNFNTGVGAGALVLNNADSNTAVGAAALLLNTSGTQNTAVGTALVFNDTGGLNTAVGYQALLDNVSGLENTAMGDQALLGNAAGNFNVAVGGAALITNTAGNDNTAVGAGALNDTTGSDNTALGFQAGILATNGDLNVYIGAGMSGVAGESNQTYIRNINTTSVSGAGTDTVTVNLSTGLLGHATSSKRYKHDIKSMENSSAALYQLKPVTFRYNEDIDHSQALDYGLVAEDVAQIDSNLAIRDRNGQIESVRYSAINAMLLNEFLKEHKAFLEEQQKVQRLESALGAVNLLLKEQEAKIEKVSAQIETSRPAQQIVRIP